MAKPTKETKTYSGKYLARVGPSLHQHLDEQAKREGMSLQQWTIELLAGASGFRQRKK